MDRILLGLVSGMLGSAVMSVALIAQSTDPLSGGAGWAGVGLLGSVLAWVFGIHLPAKDKQMRELLQSWAEERERDRLSRHEMVNKSQQVISDMMISRDAIGRELIARQELHWAKIQADIMTIDKERRDAFKDALGATLQHGDQQLLGLGNLLHKDFDHLNSTIVALQEVIGHINKGK